MVYEEYLLGEMANVYLKGFLEKKANVYAKESENNSLFIIRRYIA